MLKRGTKLVNQEVIHREDGVTVIVAHYKGQRMEILIDTADWPLVEPYSWHVEKAKKTFYAKTWTGMWQAEGRKRTRLHTVLFPDAQQVDHQDHNGLNNRRDNLRPATHQQNNQHRTKQQRPATSQYVGVSWEKSRSKWVANIKINGKRITIGRFATPEEAARARDSKAVELHGEFAALNFPVDKTPDVVVVSEQGGNQ